MKFLIAMVIAAFSFSALAFNKPYGMGGCGLGSMVFSDKKDDKTSQILAVTTNGFASNTFAISTGTSNCVTATDRTAKIKNFIEANYDSLLTDMAKGQGDSVATLSNFYGCQSDMFATAVKSNYEKVTPKNENAVQMMVNINNVISDSASLRANCLHVI